MGKIVIIVKNVHTLTRFTRSKETVLFGRMSRDEPFVLCFLKLSAT